ncbi:hypothetical protein [Variovorax sp. ZT4R33]|uniref:hypothetical protein n=1 Tax=Variovorax sp. ZT4R33 TaxID=3443743 RepID=UPI003F47695F
MAVPPWLTELLHSIRDLLHDNQTFAAALIAGVVAIVVARTTLHGVKLSLEATEKKTAIELRHSVEQEHRNREHSRHEAERERELSARKDRHSRLTTMRRDVYLAAVSDFVRFQTLLGSLPTRELKDLNAAVEIGGVSLAAQRITLVAEQATAVVARETFNAYMGILMECLSKMIPLAHIKGQVVVAEASRARAYEQAQAQLETMRQFNLERRDDRHAFDAIKAQRDASLKEVEEQSHIVASGYSQLTATQLEMTDFITESLRLRVSEQIDKLAVAIRTELELTSDLKVFRALSEAAYEQAASALHRLREDLSRQ